MAPRVIVKELVTKLIADIDGVKTSVSELEKQFEKIEKRSNIFDSVWTGLWQGVGQRVTGAVFNVIGKAIDVGISGLNKLGSEFLETLDKAGQFEQGLAEVATLGAKDMGALRAGILDVSSALGEDLETATRGVYQALSASVPEENVLAFLETAGKAAVAGVSDTETAVDALTSVINAYGLSAQDADRISDQFFATIKLGKTTFPELAAGIGQVLPLANQLGVDFSEVGGALAEMTKQGINTAEATTALNSLLTQMIRPTGEAAEEMNKLVEAAGGIGNIDLAKFMGFLESMSPDQLAKLVPEIRGLKAALALQGGLAESIDQVANSSGAADEAFKKFEGTFSFELDKFKQTISNTRVDIIEPFTTFGGDLFAIINESLSDVLDIGVPIVKDWLSNLFTTGFDREFVQSFADAEGIAFDEALEIVSRDYGISKKESLMSIASSIVNQTADAVRKDFEAIQNGEKSFGEVLAGWIDAGSDRAKETINRFMQSDFAQAFLDAVDAIAPVIAEAGLRVAGAFLDALDNAILSGIENLTFRQFDRLFRNLESGGTPSTTYQPLRFGSGGVVPGNPAYTDTIPALLSPGERVLTQEQNQEFEMTRGGTSNIYGDITISIMQQAGESADALAYRIKRALLDRDRYGLDEGEFVAAL